MNPTFSVNPDHLQGHQSVVSVVTLFPNEAFRQFSITPTAPHFPSHGNTEHPLMLWPLYVF